MLRRIATSTFYQLHILLVLLWKDLSKQVSICASPSVNNLWFMFEEQAPLWRKNIDIPQIQGAFPVLLWVSLHHLRFLYAPETCFYYSIANWSPAASKNLYRLQSSRTLGGFLSWEGLFWSLVHVPQCSFMMILFFFLSIFVLFFGVKRWQNDLCLL